LALLPYLNSIYSCKVKQIYAIEHPLPTFFCIFAENKLQSANQKQVPFAFVCIIFAEDKLLSAE